MIPTLECHAALREGLRMVRLPELKTQSGGHHTRCLVTYNRPFSDDWRCILHDELDLRACSNNGQ